MLAAALMTIALVGCGGQSASSASASSSSASSASSSAASASESSASASNSASASAASAESQNTLVAELKNALANEPAYKSVTLTEVTNAVSKGESGAAEEASNASASSEAASSEAASSEAVSESAASEESSSGDSLGSKTVYKFDESGDKLKTSMLAEIGDIKIAYYSNGNDAVCVTDGPVYSGTTEQFGEVHFAGVEAYLADAFGDLNKIIDSVGTVEKGQQGDLTVYTLTLDPEKYMASDEILTIMKESGNPVESAVFTFGFDKEGHLALIHEVVEYTTSIADRAETFSDFDSTVVDPMPAADKTYEEMEADIEEKYAALEKELDVTSEFKEEVASSRPAAAK